MSNGATSGLKYLSGLSAEDFYEACLRRLGSVNVRVSDYPTCTFMLISGGDDTVPVLEGEIDVTYGELKREFLRRYKDKTPLVIQVTGCKFGAGPQITVFTVTIENQDGTTVDMYGTIETLNAYLRGITDGLKIGCGQIVPSLRFDG